MRPLVLASQSPRRRALLEALGIEVTVTPSDAEEATTGTPESLVVENARLKRDTVLLEQNEPALVIAADTVVVVDDDILGKPVDAAEAAEMLGRLSGRSHEVLSGLSMGFSDSAQRAEGYERTEVTFRDLSDSEIDQFITAVNPVDRAGAYTVDGPGSLLVSGYRGCYYNVLGLPIVRLDNLLRSIDDGLFSRMDAKRSRFL